MGFPGSKTYFSFIRNLVDHRPIQVHFDWKYENPCWKSKNKQTNKQTKQKTKTKQNKQKQSKKTQTKNITKTKSKKQKQNTKHKTKIEFSGEWNLLSTTLHANLGWLWAI